MDSIDSFNQNELICESAGDCLQDCQTTVVVYEGPAIAGIENCKYGVVQCWNMFNEQELNSIR